MNIILVSDNLAKTRTLTLTHSRIVSLFIAAIAFAVLLCIAINYVTLRFAAQIKSPYLDNILLSAQQEEAQKNRVYLQENLNALAVRLGEMQAQLMRLDGVGEKLAKLAGLPLNEIKFDQPVGRGGALSSVPHRDLSLTEFSQQIQGLSRQLDDKSDQMGILESVLMQAHLAKKLVPSELPVVAGWHSSNFGWRIDPFTGQHAFHEGIDFVSAVGTPIHAAAGGVVIYSGLHPQYGNMIEIDHGNKLVSRYAHASKLYVKVGQVVLRGQKIGEVGSTGRSTGPHLHFEVRHNGAAQNPARFFKMTG
jgi:murein DD-endopeptidase MepM/ murein hydrolase activator NlpD